MLTSVFGRSQAQPRDLSQRLMARMYGQPSAMPPKSPTGLPISQPPPPQPVMAQAPAPAAPAPAPVAGRAPMAQPTYGTQSAPAPAAPMGGQVPQVPNNLSMFHLGQSTQKPYSDPFGDLDPDHRKQLDEYFNSLAGIDYKGSHESALMQRAALAQLMRQWESEAPVDYTSAAPVADQFDRSRGRMNAELAARGLNGGVVAGANQGSYSDESKAIGEYIRQLLQERQRQHHDDLSQFNQYTRGLNAAGLQQNINEQNSGGFWDDLLGVGGSLVGGLVGGPVGMGVGGAIGNAIGGNSKTVPQNPTYGKINDDPWGLYD